MPCAKRKYVGKNVVMEFQIGCGDVLPDPDEWKLFGSMRTKEFNLEWETTDATADDSVGALRENLATFQSLSISGDGTCKANGAGAENLKALTKHVAKPVLTDGQPFAWVRMTFPDLTFTAFMIVTNASRAAPFDDVVTWSFEASATASDFGLIVDDTPDADAAEVASVSITEVSPLALNVAETQQLTVTVLPAEAPQAVTYSTTNAAIATVSSTGLITAIAAGSASVVVTSNYNTAKVAVIAVNVS